METPWCCGAALALQLVMTAGVQAQTSVTAPAPPVAPEVVVRDSTGQVSVRAVRLNTPLRVDGKLDDEVYEQIKSIGGFTRWSRSPAPRPANPSTCGCCTTARPSMCR